MAEKMEKASSTLSNLTCPVCLNIFEEATLLNCGHTFCRKCLRQYDLSHQNLHDMVCPLCRKITKLMENRVDDLPTNVSVSGLVDNYFGNCGGLSAVFEMHPKCTACKFQGEAVSFCRTCNNYMCEECLHCHKRLTSVFEGHEIVAVEDIIKGNVSIGHNPEKCLMHRQGDKDLFCESCKVHICLKCAITGHRDHKIKSLEDFEKELKLKVNDLIQRCTSRNLELEANIQNVEAHRQEIHTALQRLREDVRQAYSVKAKQLEENQRKLIAQIDTLHHEFDNELDAVKSSNRCMIKCICNSMALVAKDRLDSLETDSLSAHSFLCEELDGLLKEVTINTSATTMEKVQNQTFIPADVISLDLGDIVELSGLQVFQCVDLQHRMIGISRYSDCKLAFTSYDAHGIDIIDSTGNLHQYANIPVDVTCYGSVFKEDMTLCVTTSSREVTVYSVDHSQKSTIHLEGNRSACYPTLSRSPTDEILIAEGSDKVYVYDPTGMTLKHTIKTRHKTTRQVSATRSGSIVTSSCFSAPSEVRVYDRNGNAGKPLQAPSDVSLYAAVGEQDRVYVASVDHKNSKVVIRLYDLDGLNLKARAEFKEINMTLQFEWCYLVSLSPDMLAFACDKKVYFLQVNL